MYPFDTFSMSERKSETNKREFVARLLLRSAIRICLGRQEGLEQTHSIHGKNWRAQPLLLLPVFCLDPSPPWGGGLKMGKVPKIRPKIANGPMRVNYFPAFPSTICVF